MPSAKPEPSARFLEFLNDPGIRVRHPRKDEVALGDIFVYPDLAPYGEGQGVVSSSFLTSGITPGRALLVTGPEDSGKTTLLKALAVSILDKGHYPVYLDGRRLHSSDPDAVINAARDACSAQYSPEDAAVISGEGPDKRVLLLDDMEYAGDAGIDAAELLPAALGHFASVVLTSGREPEAEALLTDFLSPYALAEFGHERRDELVSRWVSMGAGGGASRESRIEKARDMIDTVLGSGLVPSYPVFILTMLQIADSEDPGAPGGGSYGHYYEYMITKGLKSRVPREEYDYYSGVLSLLAYSMLREGVRAVDGGRLETIIKAQPPLQDSAPGAGEAADTLVGAEILRHRDGYYEFRHGYIYHYYAALYLSRNLGSDDARQEVARLFHALGEGENAGIALFVTYLSDDPYVTGEIGKSVERAVSREEPPAEEDADSFLDGLLSEIEKLAGKDTKLKEIRAEYVTRERTAPPAAPGGMTAGERRRRVSRAGITRMREGESLLGILTQSLARPGGAPLEEGAYNLWLSMLGLKLTSLQEAVAEDKLRTANIYIDAYVKCLRRLALLHAGGQGANAPLYVLAASLLRKDPPPDVTATNSYLEENPGRKSARAIFSHAAEEGMRLFGNDEAYMKAVSGIIEHAGGAPYRPGH